MMRMNVGLAALVYLSGTKRTEDAESKVNKIFASRPVHDIEYWRGMIVCVLLQQGSRNRVFSSMFGNGNTM